MFHSEDNISAKPNLDNFETLGERRKLRPVMKSKNICFKRSRGQLHINDLTCSAATDFSRPAFNYNDSLENSELKLTLMNLVPRDTAQETSEGVQELIKHVSDFIGKKNPFIDESSSARKEKNETARPSSKHSIRSHSSKDALRSIRKLKTTDGDRKANKTDQSSAGISRDTIVSPKSESKSLSFANRRRLQARKCVLQPESKCGPIKENEVRVKPVFKTSRNSSPKENTEKNNPHTDRRASIEGYKTEPGMPGKSSALKKPKPSEIPLRKTRTNVVSKVKLTSHAAKAAKEVTTTNSGQVNTKRRSGATTNPEIQHCTRDIDKENLECDLKSSLNPPKDNFSTIENDEADCGADTIRDFHPSRCTKNSSIPELLNHPPKARMLDMEQVRSSTFTVLTSLTSTLHRLESIHQQNVGLKENKSDKIIGSKSSQLRLLTPKSSFNLLKGKGSKKNLSSRLSSKGNKPCLKNKRKMSRTEVKASRTSTLLGKVKTGSLENSRGVKKASKPVPSLSGLSASKNRNVEREKPNQKITSGKKTDGTGRGSGFSRPKANSPKASTSKIRVGTPTGVNQKLSAISCNATSDKSEGNIKDIPIKDKSGSTNHIQLSSEAVRAVTTPVQRRKSAAVIVEGSTKTKTSLPTLIEGRDKNKKPESSKGERKAKTKTGDEPKLKKSKENSKISIKELKLIGLPLKLPEVKGPNKPEESEPEKVQLRIKIDVNSEEDCSVPGKNTTEEGQNVCSFNWLFMNNKKYDQECEEQLNDKKPGEQQEVPMKEVMKEPATPPPLNDTFVESVKDELAASKEFETGLEKHYRGSPVMKSRPRPKYKTPVIKIKKTVQKVRTRSDTGNRCHFSLKGHFNSAIHFQNKMNKNKADTKLRSGLTRSFNRDVNIGSDMRDHFDDINRDKLRRRNSEPFSFRGFIWRHQDRVPSRGNKLSASSLCSSLKHLNTDDLEDFIFWESVPPRVTSCWETSLYHFKRPWTVLSCSVFKDNRLSNTPGLILENIRNGNTTYKRSLAVQEEAERVTNSFDVEPSITQKNIDVRNWLAALNFQSPPSTSSDVIREGISSHTVTIGQEYNNPVVQKRRKVFPALKLTESEEEKISQETDKFNTEGSDIGLKDLIRRKSGGFVTAEQYFNSNRPQSYASHKKSKPLPKSKPDVQVVEDLEDSDVEKFADSETSVPKEEKMVQVVFSDFVSPPSDPPAEPTKDPASVQDKEAKSSQASSSLNWRKLLRGETEVITSNMWKYLFMFTLFVLVTYYVSRSKHSCRV